MKIGNVRLDNNIFLAPMAGVTDMPFRILCREQGCGLVYTEMVSAKGMYFDDGRSERIADIAENEKPAAVQIFGSDPDIMAEVASKLDDGNAALIDINMGCPTPKITKNGEGSALMKNQPLAESIIKKVVNAVKIPVTVKFRKGWDEDSINAVEFAQMAEGAGAAAVTVHGRTREQFYSGKADWDIIAKVKKAVKIPVIGNGDVTTPKNAEEMFDKTGCDAVMIGRGAQGNPWLFKQITHYLKTGDLLPQPGYKEKIEMVIRHMDMLVELKGEAIGVREMRKHVAWYIKGLRNAAHTRDKIFKMTDKNEIVELLNNYLAEIESI